MPTIRYKAGVDIGGTFTDIVLAGTDGSVNTLKLSSTPDNYGRAIVTGLQQLLATLGCDAGHLDALIHATTIATNAVLEGKGARTALITTAGFRDVVEIGRLRVPGLYNLGYSKPRPLALRRHRYEVQERLRANGAVDTPLDESAISPIATAMLDEKVEAIAISLLHSYANPIHEIRIRDILRAQLGDEIFLTCSHEILPEIREYERTSTTVVNAYLGPIVVKYLRSLVSQLRGIGMTAPVSVMHSNGGIMTVDAVIRKPACIIESGPAAGVIAGAFVASLSGCTDVITVDMGGTTAKAAIIEAGQPARTTEYEVGAGINLSSKLIKGGGHAVKLPFIDVSEIGAGGGSYIRLDGGGLIRVGPESAGAVPGPVCYDKGGTIPTLTDAILSLGYVNPHYLVGGSLKLNFKRSEQALLDSIAIPCHLSAKDAAYGVFSIAAATMTRAVKAVSTYRGRDPRDFALFAFGGNGPVIAHAIAALLEMRTIIVPPSPGVFSARGLLYGDTQHELVKTFFYSLDAIDDCLVESSLAAMVTEAIEFLMADGHARQNIQIRRFLDLRYAGQAFELTIPTDYSPGKKIDLKTVRELFDLEHKRTYGHSSADDVELVNLRVTATVPSDNIPDIRLDGSPGRLTLAKNDKPNARAAYFGNVIGTLDVPVLSRSDLSQSPQSGPLLIEEYDSTCVAPPDSTVWRDPQGNIRITLGVES